MDGAEPTAWYLPQPSDPKHRHALAFSSCCQLQGCTGPAAHSAAEGGGSPLWSTGVWISDDAYLDLPKKCYYQNYKEQT